MPADGKTEDGPEKVFVNILEQKHRALGRFASMHLPSPGVQSQHEAQASTRPGTGVLAAAQSPIKKPSVVVADDQQEVLQIVTETLQDWYHVVGLAANGRDLLELVHALKPDIVVLDICMPSINGIEAVFRLRMDGCSAKLVCITVHEDRDFVDAAFAAGAQGYVLKSRLATDLIPAMKHAMDNGFFVSPGMQGERSGSPVNFR